MKIKNFTIKEIKPHNDIKKYIDSLFIPTMHNVDFDLLTNSSIANAIRRVLVEELPTYCLDIDRNQISTNDEFIIDDYLIKNINLLPIYQTEKFNDVEVTVHNDTNEVIDVKASILSKVIDTKLIKNITIAHLRPTKTLKLKKFRVVQGVNYEDAAKFTLLGNIMYYVDDEHYNQFTGKDLPRTLVKDYKKFHISYTTNGNIEPKKVLKLTHNILINKLEKMYNFINTYMKTKDTNYYVDGFEVDASNDVVIYKFIGEYITISSMIARTVYDLDNNVSFVVSDIDRLDNRIAYIKIKHPSCNKILLDSIKLLMKKIDELKKVF